MGPLRTKALGNHKYQQNRKKYAKLHKNLHLKYIFDLGNRLFSYNVDILKEILETNCLF